MHIDFQAMLCLVSQGPSPVAFKRAVKREAGQVKADAKSAAKHTMKALQNARDATAEKALRFADVPDTEPVRSPRPIVPQQLVYVHNPCCT
jgi:hypothetical protein